MGSATATVPSDLRPDGPGARSGGPGPRDGDAFRQLMPAAPPVFCALFLAAGRLVEPHAPTVALGLYVCAYIAGGTATAVVTWLSLRVGRVDVNFLMLVAALGAAYLGAWTEGGILLFLFSLSNALEFHVLGRTRRAIRSLMALRPPEALVRRDGLEATVPADTLRVGDVIIVRPAERLPADGVVVRGESSIDQSPITGESLPVTVSVGALVFAGTINQRGSLDVEVTKGPQDTTLARIIALVEQAQAAQVPAQRLIDRFGQVYALAVILASAATCGVLVGLGTPGAVAFYRAITLLVVASPCAIVISTPATVLSAIANAARRGVLFKGGAFLEKLASVNTVVFDKTGTLTVGRPAVTDVIAFAGDETAVLATAAALEQRSEHALADAIVAACRSRGLTLPLPEAAEAVTGRGIRGSVGGRRVVVGSERFLAEEGVEVTDDHRRILTRLRGQGKTPILVGEGRVQGIIALADTLRPQAAATVQELRTLGISRIVVLSGDHAQAVAAIAGPLGLDDARGDLLPEQKVEAIRALAAGGGVAMIGDGVNDAPALAEASVGIALGAASTDAAMETADVVLMGDDLQRFAYALRLSRQARRVVAQNLIFAASVIVALIVIVLATGLRLAFGVVGHEGSTVVVVFNGLRLLRFRCAGCAGCALPPTWPVVRRRGELRLG